MKNLLLALTLITLTFLSCSKKDDDTPPPTPDTSLYQGFWSGTYSGDLSGTFSMNVTEIGTLTGSFVEFPSGSVLSGSGTLTESGILSITFLTEHGGSATGTFNAATSVVSGDWTNPHPHNGGNGTFSGTKN